MGDLVVLEFRPEVVEVVVIFVNQVLILNDDQVFLVIFDSRNSPVERASNNKTIINNNELVVHMGSVSISSDRDTFLSKSVDISTLIVSTFIIRDNSSRKGF